jgi:hypothetical protein
MAEVAKCVSATAKILCRISPLWIKNNGLRWPLKFYFSKNARGFYRAAVGVV